LWFQALAGWLLESDANRQEKYEEFQRSSSYTQLPSSPQASPELFIG
jgi:hypothetical protein